MAATTNYLTNLTPLRGIAALLTVIFHLDLMLGGGGNGLIHFDTSMALTRLYLMVDFFFILSGFIMCHVYSKLFEESVVAPNFKKFTIARFARVYPLHFVMLFYTIILFYVTARLGLPKDVITQVSNSGYSIVTNILLLHSMNLHNWFSWNHASWSISTEWWAYMVFPFLVKPIMRLNTMGRVLGVLFCFVGYLCITFFIIPLVTVPPEIPFVKINPAKLSINVAYQFGFLRCLFGFILGMFFYQGYKENWAKKILGSGYSLLIATVGLFACMHFNLPDVITVSFFPFILLAGAYGSKNIDIIFAKKPFQKLGDWSFSIYLVHQPLLYTIGGIMAYANQSQKEVAHNGPPPPMPLLTAWLISIAFIGLTILVASLTYRFIEVPARNRINGQPKKSPVGLTVAES